MSQKFAMIDFSEIQVNCRTMDHLLRSKQHQNFKLLSILSVHLDMTVRDCQQSVSASCVQVMCKSCVSHVQVMCKSCASQVQVMCKSFASHVQVICKSISSHVQVMFKSCASHVQVMAIFSSSWRLKSFQSCLFRKLYHIELKGKMHYGIDSIVNTLLIWAFEIQLNFGRFLTMWGVSYYCIDFIYNVKI